MVANAPISVSAKDAPEENTIQDTVRAMLEKWWLIALIATGAVLVAIVYLLNTPTIYESTVVVQVEQEEQKALNIDVTKQDLRQNELLKTLEQNFANQNLMQRVIVANNLISNPGVVPPPSFLKRQLRPLLGKSDASPNEVDAMVEFLLDRADAKLRRGTRLIDVTFEHEDPKLAQKIVGSIVQEAIQKSLSQRQLAGETAAAFLSREAETLRAKLEKSEQALQDYKEKTGSVSLENRQNIVVEKLRELSSELTRANADRLRAEADYAQIEAARDNPEMLLTINSIAAHPSVVALREMLAGQEGELAKLSQRYTQYHPKMIEAQSQLKETRRSLNEAVQKASIALRNVQSSAIARERSLELALQDQEKQALELNRQTIQYKILTREVESDREIYESVIARIKETKVAMAMEPLVYRIVEPATTAIPVKPRKLPTLFMALVGGLILGAGTVKALHSLDTALHSVDQAEAFLELPVLAAVPRDEEPAEAGSPVEAIRHPDSLVAEAFRTLRTSLVLLGRAEDRKIVSITSAVPGEGKTYISGNLAACFAQQGLRVLLIDADLRRPAVERLFFKTADATGLTEYLTGQAKADAVIRETSVKNLFCISAGGRAPNPAELLAQPSFHELMRTIASRFDRVVIDTAPINVVSDTLVLAKHVQTVCLVVDSRTTHRKAVRHALDQLIRVQAPVSGIILNCLPAAGGIDYFYHYSGSQPYGRNEGHTGTELEGRPRT
jgi:capsular exopolysaccharide synthesis family protein